MRDYLLLLDIAFSGIVRRDVKIHNSWLHNFYKSVLEALILPLIRPETTKFSTGNPSNLIISKSGLDDL